MARLVEIHPLDPQPRAIAQVAAMLRDDALLVYPTDTGFAFGAHLDSHTAADRIRQIRQLSSRHHFTLACADFAQLGQLVYLDNIQFRAIKASTPGPYTFILPATKEVPRRLAHPKKKTVGVRIPSHPVALALLRELGEPLLSSTLLLPGSDEPPTEAWAVQDELDHQVDVVIDAGPVNPELTTVVDWSGPEPDVLRVGAGDPERFR
ncbi:L-threonylcarbamoyladenylate synthase [Isoptericola sp. b441]|uniref:L-threonylcarbamoyladenylate synthase n=1 Tax=Actinotalea lenta TaxID=3064654 RepID=A0ABT9D5E9_9CELL|nr:MULTISPECIES: L-threonylcarbamoyladenylate synthase [unclassified Isoptericola]MDO8105993.1 L-threonylcarbamoyladenylate synthase [Isoptericola sp. b441]MDO8122288.1 L-threonylcarbamoyladenylate synthase [Isoptericola sp. b490]